MNSIALLCGIVSTLCGFANAGCCFPSQFSGWANSFGSVVKNGTLHKNPGTIHFWFDMVGKKQRNDMMSTVDGKTNTITFLDDYTQIPNVRYQIQDNTCKMVDPMTPQYPCIPPEVQPVETMVIGDPVKGIHASLYDITPGPNHHAQIWVDDMCIPIQQQTDFTVNGEYNLLSMTYYNLTWLIHDPSVFKIPEICKHPHVIVG